MREFLTFALNTGMRRGNLIGLQLEDIDFKNGVIHLLKTKSGKAYKVPINTTDLYTIAQLLGQSDIKMTQRYTHLAPNNKKIAVNMLGFNAQLNRGQSVDKNAKSH